MHLSTNILKGLSFYVDACIYSSSAKHPIVNEESASGTHSGGATQVNQTAALVDVTTTPSFRGSKNTSKSSTKKPIKVSSDPSTPLESPRGIRKHIIAYKPLSKASNRSDRSEKMKMATAGKITYVLTTYFMYHFLYVSTYVHTCGHNRAEKGKLTITC